ncbi:uncharacterized protein LY89DRAFT_703087 [Mollisia scopiformis]|uniref:LYC1 C-terminal domain-containing protein n=1 Tax=Mollisia scopiformis TaxID=149040 RepID=A0A132B3C9_MOLSC|nr:uncharacterized protein LY89DRAFT_703087 [Mollisia scopiformis]KUJ06157.1 hypothetical protein LY89DRAFT_703087 [Mollisia scopiformis]
MKATRIPGSNSLELCLSHSIAGECVTIWTNTLASWKDSLNISTYLKESLFLTTVLLAKEGGMTTWVLRALTSDRAGNVSDTIVHGIASVFCCPDYRGRGYALRMMRELAKVLLTCILYSDISKSYYAAFGWNPSLTNTHVVFPPKTSNNLTTKHIPVGDLPRLCEKDESMIRRAMAALAEKSKTRLTIMLDLDHMLWHIGKEDFACKILFGKVPYAKGAIAGLLGTQVWAIWTHRYYANPDAKTDDNTLYILRLVVENSEWEDIHLPDREKNPGYRQQVSHLQAVLVAAQNEAALWKLDQVKLWHPTPAVQEMIHLSGIEYSMVEREEDSIASGI